MRHGRLVLDGGSFSQLLHCRRTEPATVAGSHRRERRMGQPTTGSLIGETRPPPRCPTPSARVPIVAPPSLLVVPRLDGWVSQWDQLVDSSPLPSPFLRSWWLTGTGGPRPPLPAGRGWWRACSAGCSGGAPPDGSCLRMMGDGPLCPDHLDLLAAPGHEDTAISLSVTGSPSRAASLGPQGHPGRITAD